ncbi:Na+/H+ antiporter subunit E [Methylorubrum thiocyanatum]|uniref:Uncharacterized protein n=1 Tax=Methylorubrum thiocyanatum TaxID=47958 RepID=A0AA40RZQ3_9HYPH|nr:Na+/H+ antiporter subunit E [Methylorubrum thiocyanatum]MBA8911921.1 hypothetical protein [Methylorubrum thiocyanatum]GJE79785.1 hypothetical protein CJNNKLLH_1114 [Methylorubrum thiocyanatum]
MILRTGALWLGLFALYLGLAGQAGLHEAVTGAVVAALATAWACRVRRHAQRRFAWPAGALRHGGRTFAGLVPATARTGRVLLRAALTGFHPGHALRRPFRRGPADDPAEAGRRACAVLLASLSPDSFVLRADPGRDEALVHALGASGPASDPRWLA